jgi:hypothetical protein|tara:strand:+ start:3465 stop:4217 length:753 start_codon:yes stop_codon:yes gene_type:complete
MSSRKKQFEILFDGMQPYMLSVENMLRHTRGKDLDAAVDNANKKPTKKYAPTPKQKMETTFYPKQSDSLFWCFYIVVHGHEAYELSRGDAFKVEKEFKIASVEKLREKADQLKAFKLKRNAVENELVNEQRIGLDGLRALCIAYGVSIVYVVGRTYYDFQHGDEKSSVIVKNVEKNWNGLRHEEDTDSFRAEVIADYFLIENVSKPLKAVTTYSVAQLQETCRRLTVPILDPTGKKLGKKSMYEAILTKL